ncbi:hypothetical protein FQR65_LT02032 [Abscondita terminalis]|nr:hypothetical protein FQR65_LT02032 [Abscondita terminalis]
MMSKFLHEDIVYLESNFTHEPQHSILDPDTTSPTSMIFTVLILTISSCGIFTSLLLLYGLYMDKRTLLIPWVATVTVFVMVDVSHCVYIFIDHTLKINPLSAIVFTFDFFVGSLNVYALLCVISQYQELRAGRGRACDEQNQRIPSIHYSTQATATSFASTRKPVTYLETRPTPTQSPTGTGPRTSLATEEASPTPTTTRLGPRKSVKFEHPSQLLEPWTIEIKSPTLTRGTDTSPLIEPTSAKRVYPYTSYSHYSLGDTIFKELVKRGHEVTVITPFKEKKIIPNYTQILVDDFLEKTSERKKSIMNHPYFNVFQKMHWINTIGINFTTWTLSHPNVKKFLQQDHHFDLVIYQQLVSEAYSGFCHYFHAPCIAVSAVTAPDWVYKKIANPAPPSYVPQLLVNYPAKMNFFQRFYNTFVYVLAELSFWFYVHPTHSKLLQKHFPKAPPLDDLYYNTSLILMNSHVSVDDVTPSLPNLIHIAGAHIKESETLPPDLQMLLDNAHEGVIYFSLGSNVNSQDISDQKHNSFLKVFSRLKEKVLWKWENTTLPNKTANVNISSWFPQQAVLAHPNVKLFISHGGMMSIIEAVYFGVPVLGIPIFGDQGLNIARAEVAGFGKIIFFEDWNEEVFETTLHEMLKNESYKKCAKKQSMILNDQVIKPLDNAIFWIEYVIRHRGAPHLRSAALNLTWYQYYLLDVLLVFILLILAAIITVKITLRAILKVFKAILSLLSKMKMYILFCYVVVFSSVESAKILGVYPFTSYSHYSLGDTIFKELVKRGHEVTVITPFKEKKIIPNYTQILVDDFLEKTSEIKKSIINHPNFNVFQKMHWINTIGINFTTWTLSHPNLKKFLQQDHHFDLVIYQQLVSDTYSGFCHYFHAPCIAVSAMTAPDWVYKKIANPAPPSYVPQLLVNYPAKMTFFQRFYNTFVYVLAELFFWFYVHPTHSKLLQKHFPRAPPLDDLYYNTSLILINSHVSVDDVTPSLPNLIHIAGAHIKESETLPLDLQMLLDNAHEGVIYFSLGSNVNSQDISDQKRNSFLKVFSRLKEKVLWKWENTTLPNKTANVNISSWFPQQAILAHPNVKLFISHGGMMSTIEAVYFGVPVLGIPIFADQGLNIARAEVAAVFPYTTYSHYTFGDSIFKELVKRGHEVTVITPFKEKKLLPNYSQILIEDLFEKSQGIKNSILDYHNYNIFQKIHWIDTLGINFTKWTLSHPNVRNFLQQDHHFDLVIYQQLVSDAYNGFCHHFQTPCVALNVAIVPHFVNRKIANPGPPSYVPQLLLNYPAKMNFFQRFHNTFVYVLLELSYWFYVHPNQSILLRKHFPKAPPLDDLYYNTSLILINSHVSVDDVTPSLPNLIHIAGAHIKESETLPPDLQMFLDNAQEGVIYFSLGSNVISKDISDQKRNSLLEVFSRLKQKVLWKWENTTLPNKTSNVHIATWFPQQAILAHPNVKLFISHGGLMSTIEAVYFGVPVLGIPIFGDQGLNMARVELAGYGRTIFFEDLNEEVLEKTLQEMLNSQSYEKCAKKRSMILKDQVIKPLDNAIFWIEYVIRHQGAPHLKSAALNLTWYQYYLLDIMLVLILLNLTVVFIIKVTLRAILKCCFTKGYVGVYPYTTYSHYTLGDRIFKKLVKRGHEVTVITAFKEKRPLSNYSQILVDDLFEKGQEIKNSIIDHPNYNVFQKMHWVDALGINFTKWTLSHPNVKKFLQEDHHFDLVIYQQMISDAYNGFCHHFHAPCVAISAATVPHWVNRKIANSGPPSYVPQLFVNSPAKMNFFQRFYNTFVFVLLELSYWFYVHPNHKRLLQEHFSKSPPLDDLYYNTSLILINSHVSVNDVTPSLPNLIHIAGAHIKESETLPPDLQMFLNNAQDGVIYFSLGSNVNSKDISDQKRNFILKVFSRLKQKVLWKWENTTLPNKTTNVRIAPWFPQQAILAHPNVKKFLQEDHHFDLVIYQQMISDAYNGFCHHFHAPCVAISAATVPHWVNRKIANSGPPSYVPQLFVNIPAKMNFFQRFYNTFVFVLLELSYWFYVHPNHKRLLQEHFPKSPPLDDLYYNTSLILINSHVSVNDVTPSLPNLIHIAGAHIKESETLPPDLQMFLNNAQDGVIYFSLGSNVNSKDISDQKRNFILKVFSRLKQKVLWKWENTTLPNKTTNVRIAPWFPQQAILAHPNVKLFISHGGLMSIIEAVYFGVPVLGIPIFADQGLNMVRAEVAGYAKTIFFEDLNEVIFERTLHTMLNNQSYEKYAKKQSMILNDQVIKPLDNAIFWIEYVIRHRGAPHLKSAALNLTCVQNAKTLGVFPYPSYSNYLLGDAIFKELVKRGHEVTVITPFKEKTPLQNYSQVLIENMFKKCKAHLNVKLFISQGGIYSTIETVYFGVPVLGVPSFAGQEINMVRAEVAGYAKSIPFDNLNEEVFQTTLHEMLNNPGYKENAKRQSIIMKDQAVKPLDNAIFWIEYVISHKGAPHLKSAALKLIAKTLPAAYVVKKPWKYFIVTQSEA